MPATPISDGQPRGTQSIVRTLDVLECFLQVAEIGVTEIAQTVGLSPSTAHRIVRALVDRGYLEQNADNERYHLGRSTVVLGNAGRRHLGFDRVQPILQRFGGETGESVNMGLLDGDHVMVTVRVASSQALRFDQPVGSRIPVHCSSMGKALSAFGPGGEIRDISNLPFDEVTSATITDPDVFLKELAEVRELGYSRDAEESIVGVSCVGAPILDQSGQAVAAIAVQAPSARMSQSRAELLAARIVEIAAEVEHAMHLDVRSVSSH